MGSSLLPRLASRSGGAVNARRPRGSGRATPWTGVDAEPGGPFRRVKGSMPGFARPAAGDWAAASFASGPSAQELRFLDGRALLDHLTADDGVHAGAPGQWEAAMEATASSWGGSVWFGVNNAHVGE